MATTATPTSLAGYVDDSAWFRAVYTDLLETVPDLMWPTSVWTYGHMRRDPRLAAILAAYFQPLLRATWSVNPAGCRPEVYQQIADDMGITVSGQDKPGGARVRGVSWREHLRVALLHLTYGHMGFELGAEIRDGRARLTALAERMPQTVMELHVDRQGALTGISQHLHPDDMGRADPKKPDIPSERLVWYAHDREGGAWYGNSLLRPAFAPWLLKREMQRVHATANRRFGHGVPVGRWMPGVDPSPEQHRQLAQAVSAARVGDQSGAGLPPGAFIELVGLTGSAPDTLAFMKFLNAEMSQMALTGFLDLGQSEHGSRSLGQSFIELFHLNLQSIAEYIADVATRQIAARIVEWNWGTDETVPQIQVADVASRREVTAEALQALLAAGALSADPALEEYVRREWRLPDRAIPWTAPSSKPSGGPATTNPAPVVASRQRKRPVGKPAAGGQLSLPLAAAGGEDPVATSGVDLAAHQQAWEQSRDALLQQWPGLIQPLADDLATQVADHVDAGDLAAIGALVIPAAVTASISAALLASMTDLAASAAAAVAAEAAHQGVTITAGVADAVRLGQVADLTASVIASGYANGAAREAMLLAGPDVAGDVVAAAVREHLDALTEAAGRGWVSTGLAGALSAAQGYGRLATFEALQNAGHGLTLIASEVNDRGRCAPCSEIDGHTFESLADAISAYPMGRYKACLGADRCRGLLFAVIND